MKTIIKTKKYNSWRALISLSIFLGVPFVISFVFAQYAPPAPPPPSTIIPYTNPESTKAIRPPPSGYSGVSRHPTFYPTPPPDPKLKGFQINLDLFDFAARNTFPNEHCFFKVKGRKDIVEFIPNQQGRTFNFPTGTCNLEDEKCYIAKRGGRLPGMKKTDPPIYSSMTEASAQGFAVIPYKYVDDIDFSQCVPSWTGYFEADNVKAYLYEPPKRDYSKQSCYHPRYVFDVNPKNQKAVFCDAEKCQFGEKQYCEHKTGRCYLNDYPLKTKNGQSVITSENYIGINWDFCTDEEGRLIPEDGGPPYEKRFQPGCSYRVNAPNYHEKQYAGNTDFLIKCDENRCFLPGFNFDMKKKEYYLIQGDKTKYTKTPPFTEFLTVDWQCLDAAKVRDYNKKLLCTVIQYYDDDPKAPACQLCYENKKITYKNCRVPYDELGQRAAVP